jgi:hypothetical protein
VWRRTLIPTGGAGVIWIPVKRGVRPVELFVLGLSGAERDSYIAGEPADDVCCIASFAHALEQTSGYTTKEAERVSGTMLPEVLSYDSTRRGDLSGQRRETY